MYLILIFLLFTAISGEHCRLEYPSFASSSYSCHNSHVKGCSAVKYIHDKEDETPDITYQCLSELAKLHRKFLL